MNKNINMGCIFCFAILLLLFLYFFHHLSHTNRWSDSIFISEKLGLDVSDGICIDVVNTYSQYGNGDGEYFVKLLLDPDTDIFDKLSVHERWMALPLADSLLVLIDNGSYHSKVTGNDIHIPLVEKGFFYYYNRQRGVTDPWLVPENLFFTGSCNFAFALYDSVNLILYFYTLDT